MHSLALYFSLTFAVTWTLWILVAVLSGGTLSPATGRTVVGATLFLLGVFGPALVALAFTARAEGRAGLWRLTRQMTILPKGARWYIFAVAYYAAIKLAAAVAYRLAIGEWPEFGQTPLFLIPLAVMISTPVQAGEEIGWRGYALPRLASHVGLGPASVLLGIIWAVWHLPLFLLPGADTSGQSFTVYLSGVTALSVAIAWLYWRTGGSLLLTMLMHAAINNTKDIVPSVPSPVDNPLTPAASPVAWFGLILLWGGAVCLLILMRKASLWPPGTAGRNQCARYQDGHQTGVTCPLRDRRPACD